MNRILIIIVALVSALTLTMANHQQVVKAFDSVESAALRLAGSTNACQAIIEKAMETAQSFCQKVGRNKACYGNNLVNVEPKTDTLLNFKKVGDIANITDIRTISTAPLDEIKGVWGISLLKLQVNLPDSLPGQNVTFLIVGNTHIDNTSGDMRTFYFTSGLGTPSCKEAPKDSIIVKSPQHTQVTFTANGTQITIASTVLLRAEKGKQMSVALVEGHATVKTAQGSQELKPGQQVTIPLGGVDGLSAMGKPSEPEAMEVNDANTTSLIDSAGQMDASSEDGEATKEATKQPTVRFKPTPRAVATGAGNSNGNNASGNGNSNGSADAGNGNGNSSGNGNGNSNGNGNGSGNGNGNGNGH